MNRPSRLPTLLFIGLDLLFCPLVSFAFIQLFVGAHLVQAALILGGLSTFKVALCIAAVRLRWRTYDIFSSADRPADKDRLVGRADESLQAFGATMAVVYPGTWVLMLLTAYGIFANAGEHFLLPAQAGLGVAFAVAGTTLGSLALAFPLAVLLAAGPAG